MDESENKELGRVGFKSGGWVVYNNFVNFNLFIDWVENVNSNLELQG